MMLRHTLIFALLCNAFVLITGRHSVGVNEQIDNEMTSPFSNKPVSTSRRIHKEWITITASPTSVTSAVVGEPIELECEAMGSPPPNIQWRKDDKPITENDEFDANTIDETSLQAIGKTRSRLVINYALPVHRGTYTCLAESGSRIISDDAEVDIKTTSTEKEVNFVKMAITASLRPPRIIQWSPTIMDYMDSEVTLKCHSVSHVTDHEPSVTIWFDPLGKIVPQSDKARVRTLSDGSLNIRHLQWEDMGVYNCLVRDANGQDSAETFVYPIKIS